MARPAWVRKSLCNERYWFISTSKARHTPDSLFRLLQLRSLEIFITRHSFDLSKKQSTLYIVADRHLKINCEKVLQHTSDC